MKHVLCVIALTMFVLTACSSVPPAATATLTPTIAPTETAIPTSTPQPTATATTAPTETSTSVEAKTFKACAPRDFEGCDFDLTDAQKGTGSDFYKWYMANIAKPFSPNAKPLPLVDMGALIPDPSTAPHFTDSTTLPYQWDDIALNYEWKDPQGTTYKYIVYPIGMPDTSNPNKNTLMYGFAPLYYQLKGIHISVPADTLKIIN
jgi:hypothetical protein